MCNKGENDNASHTHYHSDIGDMYYFFIINSSFLMLSEQHICDNDSKVYNERKPEFVSY